MLKNSEKKLLDNIIAFNQWEQNVQRRIEEFLLQEQAVKKYNFLKKLPQLLEKELVKRQFNSQYIDF